MWVKKQSQHLEGNLKSVYLSKVFKCRSFTCSEVFCCYLSTGSDEDAAVFQVYSTFRRHADHRLSEVWGLWRLHVYSLHSAAAGAETATAQSPKWALLTVYTIKLNTEHAHKNSVFHYDCQTCVDVVVSLNNQQRSAYLNVSVWGSIPLGDIQNNLVWIYEGEKKNHHLVLVLLSSGPEDHHSSQ